MTAARLPAPAHRLPAVGLGLFNGILELDEQTVTPEWQEYEMNKALYQNTDYLACEWARLARESPPAAAAGLLRRRPPRVAGPTCSPNPATLT